MTTVDLREHMNPVYWPAFYNRDRWFVIRGSAGSGKSWFCAQKLILRLMGTQYQKFGVTRKVGRTLRASVFARIHAQIAAWGLSPFFSENKTEMTFTYLPNGNQIICLGLDDPEKLKSIDGLTGFWHEEPTELNEEDINQCDLRLRGEITDYFQHLLSFNPISAAHWLKKRFYDTAQPSCTTLKTTYQDNAFIDKEYATVLENLKTVNPMSYQVYALGEWGVFEGLIYQPFDMSPWPAAFDETFFGLDFGFNNPTALLRVDVKDQEPYVTELIYETGLTNMDLIRRMEALGIKGVGTIYSDAAEPARIEEIRRAGFDCRPANKGPNSVGAGISLCQSLKIHSRPENVNLHKEQASYAWAKDKNGNATDVPVKWMDHLMDALRYCIQTRLHRRRETKSEAFAGMGVF
jgi:phage terminase large subunit